MAEDDHSPLTLAEMARWLRVPQKWLRQEAEAGNIPHLRAGSRLLFDPEAVERVIRDRLREAEAKLAAEGSGSVAGRRSECGARGVAHAG